MRKPKRLLPQSKIAIISPSNGVPYLFPDLYELGLRNLKEVLGFEIVEMPTARMNPDDLYRHPELRARDINECFRDKQIDGIITSIGGYESIRILPFLDTDLIVNNPKFIMGFSDATTFLAYLNTMGMNTFYGPTVMAGFAQIKHLPSEFVQHLKTFLFSADIPYHYEPYKEWTNGYQDWRNLATLGECQEFYENAVGWKFLQGNSVVQGSLWGGCIEVLEFLKSTKYWPDSTFWHGKILFFETSEDKPTPMQVGYMLRNYGMQGIFQQVNGIIFGRAKDYSDEEKSTLQQIILNVVRDEFGANEIPILVDVDFGHTDPKLILPIGCIVQLNPDLNRIILMEDPFRS